MRAPSRAAGRCRRALAAAVLCTALFAVAGCITTDSAPPLEEEPTEAAAYNVQLGANYLRQGDLQLAKDKIDKALQQDPQLALAQTYAGLLYDRLNEPQKADYHFRRALKLAPNDSVTLNLYGAYLCRRGQPGEAEEYFLSATRDPLYRTPEVAYTNAGVCLVQAGEEARAEAHFRRALEVNARYPDALWQMARLSETRGSGLQARAFFQRYAEVGPMNAAALLLGFRIERSLGDAQRAAGYAERLLEDFPDSVEAQQLLESSRG